jgi:hypothetical protein
VEAVAAVGHAAPGLPPVWHKGSWLGPRATHEEALWSVAATQTADAGLMLQGRCRTVRGARLTHLASPCVMSATKWAVSLLPQHAAPCIYTQTARFPLSCHAWRLTVQAG